MTCLICRCPDAEYQRGRIELPRPECAATRAGKVCHEVEAVELLMRVLSELQSVAGANVALLEDTEIFLRRARRL